jgi:biotin carboxyl carrier protein
MQSIVQAWLDLQCGGTAGVAAGLVLLTAPDGLSLRPAAVWPRGSNLTPGIAAAAKSAFEKKQPVLKQDTAGDSAEPAANTVVSHPLLARGRAVGAVALSLEAGAEPALDKFERAAAEFESLLSQGGDRSASAAAKLLHLQATALNQQRFAAAATAVATELAQVLECDRVTIGFAGGRQIWVAAVSHTADFDVRQSLYRSIGAAMDESADQAAVVVYPEPSGAKPLITLAHAELARLNGGTSLCTVPLVQEGEVSGAITLERDNGRAFDTDTIALGEHIACVIGPLLALKRSSERSLWRRVCDSTARAISHLRQPGNLELKLALAAAGVTAIGLLFVPVEYRVAAPARLEGSTQRALVAPVDGFVKQVHVRPGDAVKDGQVLVELATEELRLERKKWESEVAQHENGYGEALAKQDRAQIVILQARIAEARAQLALVEQQLSRTQVAAPLDGIVIKGDLTQSLGAPVKRGDLLLTVAPKDSHRIIVEVDERDVGHVKAGQHGALALSALPRDMLPIRVERVTPVATTAEGRHFFEVEASLEKSVATLRPGLEGVAKIDIDRRPIIWIWAHRLVAWVRLAAWSWLG